MSTQIHVARWSEEYDTGVCPGCGELDQIPEEHEGALHECAAKVWQPFLQGQIDEITKIHEPNPDETVTADAWADYISTLYLRRDEMQVRTYPKRVLFQTKDPSDFL